MGPGRALLAMNLPVGLRDGIELQHIIGVGLWPAATQAFAVDAAVDHDMRHVDAEASILARHALGDHTQPGLGGGKMSKAWLAAQARGGAGKYDGAAAQRRKSSCRFASGEEPTEAAD